MIWLRLQSGQEKFCYVKNNAYNRIKNIKKARDSLAFYESYLINVDPIR